MISPYEEKNTYDNPMFGYRVEQGSIVILLESCRGKGTREEKEYYTPTIELYLLK